MFPTLSHSGEDGLLLHEDVGGAPLPRAGADPPLLPDGGMDTRRLISRFVIQGALVQCHTDNHLVVPPQVPVPATPETFTIPTPSSAVSLPAPLLPSHPAPVQPFPCAAAEEEDVGLSRQRLSPRLQAPRLQVPQAQELSARPEEAHAPVFHVSHAKAPEEPHVAFQPPGQRRAVPGLRGQAPLPFPGAAWSWRGQGLRKPPQALRCRQHLSIQPEEAAVPLPWQQSHPQGVQDPGATQEPEASTVS